MIAPCGLDCSLCNEALKSEKPCAGCTGPDENKPEFCSSRCSIINCDKLKENQYRFCSECIDYPCEYSKEREGRYMSQYVMKESPLTNLNDIGSLGMDGFLEKQRQKWTCKDCTGTICVHTGICNLCGKIYAADDVPV